MTVPLDSLKQSLWLRFLRIWSIGMVLVFCILIRYIFWMVLKFYLGDWFILADDDEIDYSIKPEFHDPDLDDKDELWIQKKRKGFSSDAVLSCPACFTTVCLECQRYVHLFVAAINDSFWKGWVITAGVWGWGSIFFITALFFYHCNSFALMRGNSDW